MTQVESASLATYVPLPKMPFLSVAIASSSVLTSVCLVLSMFRFSFYRHALFLLSTVEWSVCIICTIACVSTGPSVTVRYRHVPTVTIFQLNALMATLTLTPLKSQPRAIAKTTKQWFAQKQICLSASQKRHTLIGTFDSALSSFGHVEALAPDTLSSQCMFMFEMCLVAVYTRKEILIVLVNGHKMSNQSCSQYDECL